MLQSGSLHNAWHFLNLADGPVVLVSLAGHQCGSRHSNARSGTTRVDFATVMLNFIEIFYYRQRRHPQLRFRTPVEYKLTYEVKAARLNCRPKQASNGGTGHHCQLDLQQTQPTLNWSELSHRNTAGHSRAMDTDVHVCSASDTNGRFPKRRCPDLGRPCKQHPNGFAQRNDACGCPCETRTATVRSGGRESVTRDSRLGTRSPHK